MEYWNNEEPIVVDTGANVLRYYKEAEKLQVSLSNWTASNGDIRSGKTVTVDVTALRESTQAIELLKTLCK